MSGANGWLSWQAIGLRVGQIASLTVGDVIDADGNMREQLRLLAAMTRGGHARVVFLSERLRKEVRRYRDDRAYRSLPPRTRCW